MSDPAVNNANASEQPKKNGRYDIITHRLVVISLGATVLCTGVNMTILQALGKESPPALANLGAVAIGALAMTLSHILAKQ